MSHTRFVQHREAFTPYKPRIVGDADQRLIAGVATSATPDEHNTIIDPTGVSIDPGRPLPLLRSHQHDRVVGEILELDPTGSELRFKARVDDDETWTFVRTGAMSGISIGFNCGEEDIEWPRDGRSPAIIRRCRLLEISIVAAPSNPSARIEEVRSSPHPTQEQPAMSATLSRGGAPRVVSATPAHPFVQRRETRPFSLSRALALHVAGRSIDGIEGEVVHEMTKRSDVNSRGGIRIPAKAFPGATRATSTNPGSAAAISPEAYLGELFDDVSAARQWGTTMRSLGFYTTTSAREQIRVPKRLNRVTASWGPKDAAASDGGTLQTDDDVLQPLFVKSTITIQRSALSYTSPDANAILFADLRNAIDQAADTGILWGDGTNNQPLGLLHAPQSPTDIGGRNLIGKDMLDLRRKMLNRWKDDSPSSNYRWLMSHSLRDALTLTSTKIIPSTSSGDEWRQSILPFTTSDGMILDILPVASGKVPVTGTPPLERTILYLVRGAMGVIVFFASGSVEVIADPYSLSTSGALRLTAFLDLNCMARDPWIVSAVSNIDANVMVGTPGP